MLRLSLLDSVSATLCGPITLFILLQGCIVLTILTLAFLWAAESRRAALKRHRHQPSGCGPDKVDLGDSELPAVSVVMPVSRASPQKLVNWRSQLATDYPGSLEFIFVAADAARDDACEAVRQLQAERAAGAHTIRLVLAGPAKRSSQKIHNQRAGAGAASPTSRFVLFLDDDIWLHPGTVRELTDAMLRRPSALLATGYPLDLPRGGAGLWSYCSMGYHLPLIVAFSQGHLTTCVWGGCMMLRAAELRDAAAPRGVPAAWGDGAYSDDLIVAALASERRLPIACPAEAVFPAHLPGRCTPRQWWNYLRRQLFVLDTYTSDHNRRVNHCHLACLFYAPAAFALPALPAALHLLRLLGTLGGLGTAESTVSAVSAASGVSGVSGVPGGAGGGGGGRGGGGAGAGECAAGRQLAVAYWALFVAAVCSIRRMYGITVALFRALSPKWRGRAPHGVEWLYVAAGLLITNAALPFGVLITLIRSDVEWAGIRYRKEKGRVVVLERLDDGHGKGS